MAPEQITGTCAVDGRADQYALGCMLYEALTGRQPFKGDSAVATAAKRLSSEPPPVRSVRPDVPRGLDAVVMRALGRRPEDRYPSAGHLADALLPFADANTAQTAALAAGGRATPTADGFPGGPLWPATPPTGTPGPRAQVGTGRGRPVEEPPVRVPAAPARSRLDPQPRWLSPALVLVLLAGALVGFALATGQVDTRSLPDLGSIRDDPPARTEPPAGAAPAEPLAVAAITAFDPPSPPSGKVGGDGEENDATLEALIDGDAATTWRTDLYRSAEFGGLKDGVGFALDLGSARSLSAVELTTTTPGVNYELRVADERPEQLDGWRRVATVTNADAETTVTFDEPVRGRHLLVWVVAPLPGTPFKAEFADVTALGSPATGPGGGTDA